MVTDTSVAHNSAGANGGGIYQEATKGRHDHAQQLERDEQHGERQRWRHLQRRCRRRRWRVRDRDGRVRQHHKRHRGQQEHRTYGGGIYNDGTSGTATLNFNDTHTSVNKNTATQANGGGGIFNTGGGTYGTIPAGDVTHNTPENIFG